MKTILLGMYLAVGSWLFMGEKSPANDTRPTSAANTLTLNGHAFDHLVLPINSRGVLAVVTGDPRSNAHKPVAFRVYLRRAGTIVEMGASNDKQAVYSAQLAELLAIARGDDELIIEPVSAPGKRIINILNILTINWFSSKGGGC
jgi:hypothetical protein